MPHLAIDPVPAAAQLATALQTLVSREEDPLNAKVVSVTVLQATSNAYNVIPSTAVIQGTTRSLSSASIIDLRERIQTMAESVANAHRLNVTVGFSKDFYPATVNDGQLWQWFKQVMSEAQRSLPVDAMDLPLAVSEVPPTMGGEDFAFFAESVPGLFVLLGQGDGEGVAGQPCTSVTVHNPKFAIDERVLDLGAALHPYLALSAIDRLRRNDTDAAHAIKTEP